MQNIEIKAKYKDFSKAHKLALESGARFAGELHQVDTYFRVSSGRLKFREINNAQHQLIFYRRPNRSGPRISDYQIFPGADLLLLKAMLSKAIGIWKTVEKHRHLFIYDEVRIHLDKVKSLGHFIEFEGVMTPGLKKNEVKKKVERLMLHFQIQEAHLIDASYSDLI